MMKVRKNLKSQKLISQSIQTHIKRIDGGLKVPLRDNPALNKIGPKCTPWIIFCTRVHLHANICPRMRTRPVRQKRCVCAHKPDHITVRFWSKIIFHLDLLLTWPLIHHSGCGKNSCTATDRSSLRRQVHLWPRRAPGAGRGTFWPTFTHTQLAYMRPVCAHGSQTDLLFSLIYRNIIRMALSHRFAVP